MSTNRPLSPHLSIHKKVLTATFSIFHRFTGIFLSLGSALVSLWVLLIALGPSYYNLFELISSYLVFKIFLFIWSIGVFYNFYCYCLVGFMKNYSRKWILQRITALILIPLTFWFVFSCVSFSSMQYEQIVYFFSSFFNSTLFLIMIISMFVHMKLGCETIAEDYISSINIKTFTKLFITIVSYVFILISVLSILRIALFL